MKLGVIAHSFFLATLTLTFFSFTGIDHNKVIYGEDTRVDLREIQDWFFYDLARSTAAMVPVQSLKEIGELTRINGLLYSERGICSDEKFANQIGSLSYLCIPNNYQ